MRYLLLLALVVPVLAQDSRPNVLFIAVDDMRTELGCYGSSIVSSPNIDALAQRGTLFERAYCQQAVCNPSRASLLTGLRPETLGIWNLATHFRERVPDVVTLPQHFMSNGYHAEGIGKIFHNWRQDDWRGDAASWSVPAVMHYASHGSDQAVVEGDVPPNLSDTPKCEIRNVPDEAYFDGRVAQLAVQALGRLKEQADPFFLAVGFWKPHSQFNAPKRYWDRYDPNEIKRAANPLPPRFVPDIALHDAREMLRSFTARPHGRPTRSDEIDLRHGYYAAISYVDAQVGKVVDELNRLGLADNTIIVFWSDHGYHLGEHGLWAKTSNFELDARVPLIIAEPDRPSPRRSKSLVELLDLYPTLSDLAGLPAPSHLEGVSLRPALDDPQAQVKPAAFTWHPRPAYPADDDPLQALGYSMRTDRFRYTEWRSVADNSVVARELYDHDNDPDENINHAGNPRYADQIEELGADLLEARPLGSGLR